MTSIPQSISSSSTTSISNQNGSSNHIKRSSVATPAAVDTLTSTMQASNLAESGSSAYHQIDASSFKTLLLQEITAEDGNKEVASSSSLPPLRVLLHDRISAHGGELVIIIGETPSAPSSNGDTPTAPLKKLDNVDHVSTPFTSAELKKAIENVKSACKEAACEAVVLNEGVKEGSAHAFVMLRRIPAGAEELLELRIAVVGNVDAGKSSTLGVLTRGGLDDGRGKARVNLFRHKHEIESGRTSSVGMEIMGFDTKGEVVMNVDKKNPSEPGRKMTWEEISEKAAKIVSFIDLAGHERYLKTTVGGLTGCLPDYVMLMVGANAGLIGMSKEHLGVTLALSLSPILCITKVDMTPPHILEATIKQVIKILKSPGCRKTPIFVESEEQAIDCALRLRSEKICPIFQISNVTGQNLNLLRSFFNVLPPASAGTYLVDAPFKFQLQDVFSVPFVGCVVSGVIQSGVVRTGDNLMIGPDSLGQFVSTSIRSIQRKRVNVDSAVAGQSASFALKKIRRNQVRKGMVMLGKTDIPPKAHLTCDAEILCLYHSTTLSIGSNMVLHVASVRQTVKIVQIAKLDGHGKIIASSTREHHSEESDSTRRNRNDANLEKPVVRTGDRALLRLQFIVRPEAVEIGTKLIAREARTRLVGKVIKVGATGPLSTVSSQSNNDGPNSHNSTIPSTVLSHPAEAAVTAVG